jgi:FkbM family methyltransferase
MLGAAAAMPFLPGCQLLLRRGMAGATGNLYVGLQEPAEMAFVALCLRPGDLFVDAGANAGVYSVLAAGYAGAGVIAVEPDPEALSALRDNLCLNRLAAGVECVAAALGRREGRARMTSGLDATNRLLRTGESFAGAEREVVVTTLDRVLDARRASLIKIDVEGAEADVLEGARGTLGDRGLLGLLVEVGGAGEAGGATAEAVDGLLSANGFRRCEYRLRERRLLAPDPASMPSGHSNLLYLRDLAAVQARLDAAPRLPVLDLWL